MNCEVEYTDEFELWWDTLNTEEQIAVTASVTLLERLGINLKYPYSSQIIGSKYRLRELRIQHKGKPYRILYTFDPRRNAILLIAGNKASKKRWYETNVPIAERLYEKHLQQIEKEI
ncbi:addiction module toxin RelE [Ursidibacter arcticus]|uniref:type II toxin-antitoxin system RelE/ParE family toxin n=1 Tax=Ursidibacter arcticus TaxID=1524965 RepID=UPI0012FB2C4F|nr:type II toxin-antitoxin system RelE/ParE family toxin [Ursidibacter arcticus]KAE9532892.1 addiction module toxin RelE [Ursidibacter arcticus]